MTYDFNSTATKRELQSAEINALVDNAIAKNHNEEPRSYLGASQIGDECHRRIQYEVTQAPGLPFEPKLLRIFKRGHIFESYVEQLLKDAGFELTATGERQAGFNVANGQFRGHLDGILLGGPEIDGLKYPAVWENKVLGAKGWRAVQKGGLAKAYPKYADQIAIYQAYMDCTTPALFTALCADTMEFYFEIVPFDEARAQAASDRAVTIIRANAVGELLPRVGGDPDGFPCKWCKFRDHCWADGKLGPVRGAQK